MRGLCYFFLSILTQVSSSTPEVIGLFGHNVTLPCRYDVRTHGVLSFCWGRGSVPAMKCTSTILTSEYGAVLFVESPRYRLLGRVTDGDVSLTILDAQRSDAGVYGCRLQIPGWFNDEKVNTRLVMEEEQPVTQDWSLTTGGTQGILTTVTKNVEVGAQTLEIIGIATTAEKFKLLQEVGDIGRVAAIFLFTIIVIVVFVFRRRFLPKKTPEHLNTSTAENIYEEL